MYINIYLCTYLFIYLVICVYLLPFMCVYVKTYSGYHSYTERISMNLFSENLVILLFTLNSPIYYHIPSVYRKIHVW